MSDATATRKRKVRIPKVPVGAISRLLRHNALLIFSCTLLAISVFFFVNAEALRRKLQTAKNSATLDHDAVVRIDGAIDGDELRVVSTDGQKAIVRILGIKAFDPFRSDPKVGHFAKAGYQHLKSYVGRSAKLVRGKTEVDQHGRILAYVQVENRSDGAFTEDVGLDLLKRGFVLVYTRYEFGRQKEYGVVESDARLKKVGLWSDRDAAAQAVSLQRLWLEQRD